MPCCGGTARPGALTPSGRTIRCARVCHTSARSWSRSASWPMWSSTPRNSTCTNYGTSSPGFKNPDTRPMLVSVVSFGYRYGVPSDADLVFDVRFLPNPHFVPRLRPYTGKDPKVRRYIQSFPQTGEFLRRIESLLTYLIPHYIREGKSYLTIAFGCTGG